MPGSGFPHVNSTATWMHLQETALGPTASGHRYSFLDQCVQNPASCDRSLIAGSLRIAATQMNRHVTQGFA